MSILKTARQAAVFLVLAGTVIGGPASASAAPPDVHQAAAVDIVNLRSVLNNKCLEIRDSNPANGAYVGMWDCWGGLATYWFFYGDEIRSMRNGKCLEVRDSKVHNGALVSMWDCWGGAATHWYRDGDLIRSKLNNKCLEVRDSNIANGAVVSMWDCWGGAATRWY